MNSPTEFVANELEYSSTTARDIELVEARDAEWRAQVKRAHAEGRLEALRAALGINNIYRGNQGVVRTELEALIAKLEAGTP